MFKWSSCIPACSKVPRARVRVLHNQQRFISKSRAAKLRDIIHGPDLGFLMEAHNGLSARIVEESGFKGIWGSGLAISASMGRRDANEASWTQVLEVCEWMSDAANVPILLDADTGYGNFNNARLLVKKLEQRGIAGACIEDKVFPKQNSLLANSDSKERRSPLARIEEFAAKIQCMKDHQKDPDFQVIARVEAFTTGWGLEEALKRSEAYVKAGADAILIHSKKADHSDIEAFMKAWENRHPVIIVPTKYYRTPTNLFREWQVAAVIWANHNIRTSVKAMQEVCHQIKAEESLSGVETTGKVVPVDELFRLQVQHELTEAEKRYLR